MEKLAELHWIWIILGGAFGIGFILSGITGLQANLQEKPNPSTLSEKDRILKKVIEWNIPPLSNEASGWQLLVIGIGLSMATLIAIVMKFKIV